jgi:hypothetical protein
MEKIISFSIVEFNIEGFELSATNINETHHLSY